MFTLLQPQPTAKAVFFHGNGETSHGFKLLIGRALALALCSTLSNQQLLEKYLEKYLLNASVLQML